MLNSDSINKHYKALEKIIRSKSLNEFLVKVKEAKVSTNQRRILTQNYRKLHPEISLNKIRYEWEKLTGRDAQRYHPPLEIRRKYYFKRSRMHNYRPDPKKRILWDEDTIWEFLSLNKKDKTGEYIYSESYLAKYFNTTIHAISYWRRKHKLTLLILEERSMKIHKRNLLFYMVCGEKPLKDYYERNLK